ncbi:hypothetical protein Nepgr_028977 [Nepenthes gracilis]|uniref:BRF2-like C-terminal domain-containing protein n=1 Tax=Nepenthes gracilis TaxID=150966 RepID=A0AAD3Y4K3_NEPGR|nr:hypothetical protein Nepgr_028977 [Nepenthes gracilis]
MAMPCKSCGSRELVLSDISGSTVCSNCGVVQDFDDFQLQYGGISGPQGTFVRLGTAGAGTHYSYKERKLFQSSNIIEDITYRLNFTEARKQDVKIMIEKITEGEFGVGDWFSILVAACSYIVMRDNNKPLPISEVAETIGCDLFELGKMVSRVVEFLGLQLPEFNIVAMLERSIREFPGFSEFDEDKLDLMIKQGNFLVQCATKWFLTTGRRPGPMVVAVLVLVAGLNGITLKIEDAATELNTVASTCKKRYNELLEALVKVAQSLPWGKDVNVKNIMKNARFVIQYIDFKSRTNRGAKRWRCGDEGGRFDLEDVVGECLTGNVEYGKDSGAVENDSRYYNELDYRNGDLGNGGKNPTISPETLQKLYRKIKTDVSHAKLVNGSQGNLIRNRHSGYDLQRYYDWWSGRSGLCKKLLLEQILEKDVGLDALPPSYIRGRLAVSRRREKIEAAKKRINEVACDPNIIPFGKALCGSNTDMDDRSDICLSKSISRGRKRRKKKDLSIDWEDFVIETLILHQVKEEEIEKGHYNSLLDVHVFSSRVVGA